MPVTLQFVRFAIALVIGLSSVLLFLRPAYVGLRRGEMEMPIPGRFGFLRSQQPWLFWLAGGLNLFLGAIGLVVASGLVIQQLAAL